MLLHPVLNHPSPLLPTYLSMYFLITSTFFRILCFSLQYLTIPPSPPNLSLQVLVDNVHLLQDNMLLPPVLNHPPLSSNLPLQVLIDNVLLLQDNMLLPPVLNHPSPPNLPLQVLVDNVHLL